MTDAKPIIESSEIRLAMLGMVEGNGHPYSWSAIFNGFEPAAMADCGYPVIPEYLAKQPEETFGIAGAKVTHVWCDDVADAQKVAKASRVPNVAKEATDVIGEVDAVIVATDIGSEHIERCRPFVEAGLPVFVDKPLVDAADDLAVFNRWVAEGRPILSGSSLRYTKEYMPWRVSTHDLGELRFVNMTMGKTWERYGIHALEAVYPIVGPGFTSVRNTGTEARNIVHLTHERGCDVVLATVKDMMGGGGRLTLCGTRDAVQVRSHDSYYSFKTQLERFVEWLRTGVRPFPWEETDELMRIIVAGIESRARGGERIDL
jgi:hypothetical protein